MPLVFTDPTPLEPTDDYEQAKAMFELAQSRAEADNLVEQVKYWQAEHTTLTQIVGLLLKETEDDYPEGFPIDLETLDKAPAVEILRTDDEAADEWSTERILRIARSVTKDPK